MKSIFKKIAFVLALAMVVTMMPAKAAAAAASDGPQMYPTLKLYIGGDVTGKYTGEGFAKVWNWKEDYSSVVFRSDNEKVATVNAKSGKVTAVGVGKANITAAFTAEDGSVVNKICVVTVKKNAVRAGIGAAQKAELEAGIEVGDTLQLKAVRKGADGEEAWSGRDILTDGVRFESTNPEIFTVGATKGKLTAVSEGTATLKVWSVQSEGKDENGVYPRTSEVIREYTVNVVAKPITAKQSAYNAFVLTFPNADEAKEAKSVIEKSLTDADAAVSEAKEIVKVYKVLTNSNNARREVFIGGVGVEGANVTVTMFNELDENSTYVICYKEQELTLNTTAYIASGLYFGGYGVETAEDYSIQDIWASLVTADGVVLGQKGNGSCQKYLNWEDSLIIEDTNTALVHNEYQFDAALQRIWFYTTDGSFKVNLKATFEDWANVVSGSQANVITAFNTVSPKDSNIYVNEFIDWCIVDGTVGRWNADWSNKTFASEDEGFHLLVKANITELGKNAEDKYSDSYSAEDYFTFVSSNDDKLSVNQETGELYPPKTPMNGTVGIHVYYKGVYVGTCQVKVITKRTFAAFSATGSISKVSYSTTNPDVIDDVIVTLYAKDQLGANFNNPYMNYTVEVSESSLKQYFENDGRAERLISDTWDGYPQFKLELKDGISLPTNIVNVRVKCTAVYAPQDGTREITKQYPVSFSLKDTSNSTETSWKLSLSSTSVDMTLDNGKTAASKDIKINAYSYDKDGFKVAKLVLDGSDGYGITIKYGSLDVDAANISTTDDGKTVVFSPVTVVTGRKLATVSGGAIEAWTPEKVIEKVDTGNYVIALNDSWWQHGKGVLNSLLLNVTDSQTTPGMTWVKSTTDAATILAAIQDAVKITYPNSWTNVTPEVYYGYYAVDKDGKPVEDKNGNPVLVTKDDYTLTGANGQNIYIAKVRYAVEFVDGWYEFEIPVKRTIVYGTNN